MLMFTPVHVESVVKMAPVITGGDACSDSEIPISAITAQNTVAVVRFLTFMKSSCVVADCSLAGVSGSCVPAACVDAALLLTARVECSANRRLVPDSSARGHSFSVDGTRQSPRRTSGTSPCALSWDRNQRIHFSSCIPARHHPHLADHTGPHLCFA